MTRTHRGSTPPWWMCGSNPRCDGDPRCVRTPPPRGCSRRGRAFATCHRRRCAPSGVCSTSPKRVQVFVAGFWFWLPRYRSEATGTVPARGVRRHARAHTTRDDADDRAPRARRPRRDRRVRLEGSSRPTRERDEKLDRCSCSSPPFARAPFVRRHRRPASRARIAPRLPRGPQRRRRGRAPRGRSLRGPTRRHEGQPHGRR